MIKTRFGKWQKVVEELDAHELKIEDGVFTIIDNVFDDGPEHFELEGIGLDLSEVGLYVGEFFIIVVKTMSYQKEPKRQIPILIKLVRPLISLVFPRLVLILDMSLQLNNIPAYP